MSSVDRFARPFTSELARVASPMSPMFGRSNAPPPPSFAPVASTTSFPPLTAKLSLVPPPPVSSAAFPTASKPQTLSFAEVLKSNPPSGIKLVAPAPVPASATAPLPPFRLLEGKRTITEDSGVVGAQPFTLGPRPRQSSRRRPPTPASASSTSSAAPRKDKGKGKGKGESEGARPTKRGVSRAIVQPKPVVQLLTAQQETELLQKQIKAQFLKEHSEEAKEKNDFIKKENEIVKEILKDPERAPERAPEAMSTEPTISEPSKAAIMREVEEIKETETREKTEVMNQEIAMRQEIEMQGKRRRDAAMSAARSVISEKEKMKGLSSIPVFQDYTPEQIGDFILTQFPPDVISVLDNFENLSLTNKKEIIDFIILKYKAVMLNSPIDTPNAADVVYNQLGIKSLPLVASAGMAGMAGMHPSATALLVCEVDPLRCPPASDWCCCLSSMDTDRDRDFTEIAALIKEQGKEQGKKQGLPFVTANPDIQRMMARCRHDDIRVHVPVLASALAASAALAAAPGAGGEDPAGFDDPFPSVIIGDERIVYSIGPILDAESILGRPLIMIRIHNYKTGDYPNGIYFWVYPSFSEGGANRVFLIIGNGQFMKGPDYTLTTFILDLLQVHINKYYTKHFVNKQGPGFTPTILNNVQDIVCFFGGMIHLQSIWVHDLIAGRDVNLDDDDINPLGPVPAGFNRHCYTFSSELTDIKKWFFNGIPDVADVDTFVYSPKAAFFATQFLSENRVYTGVQFSNSSFPLFCCLTTIFHKYRDARKTAVNNFYDLFKRWPDTLFVQGCHIVPGVSPVGCVVAGTPSNIAGMRYNVFIEHLAPLEFVKKFKSLRLVPPIVTPETGVPFTMVARMGRNRILVRELISPGLMRDVQETCLMVVNLDQADVEIRQLQSQGASVYDNDKAQIIYRHLREALRRTIDEVTNVFFSTGRFQRLTRHHQLEKVQLCFKHFIGIDPGVDVTDSDELLMSIIIPSVQFLRDGITLVKDSPLYKLTRTLESGIYRHLIMSSILDEYTRMPSYPINIPQDFDPVLNPQVTCSFLNSEGQYVELPGGFGARQLGNCDFSGIFQHPSFNPYIFSATRKSMTFPHDVLEGYMQDPRRVHPQTAARDATIPVKVHTKMFLVRLVFSTTFSAIQIVVCVSSTICVASPVGGQPYISFGVDVQFNVVSIGPINTGQGGSMSTDATILATMCDYFSLGCMGAAKKGEYSLTAGYQQFFDYFDNFFRNIITECISYVSAYISPFNCRTDLVMKHFGRVFDDVGDNPISAAIRGMWGWWDYLQHVQPDVCVVGGINAASIETAITSGRRDMQLVVQALFDPILGQLDAQAVGDFTGDVRSEIGSASSSERSSERSDSGSSVSSGMSSLGSAAKLLLADTLSSRDSDSWPGSMHSQGSRDSASSAEPLSFLPSATMAYGGTNKKTRKYKTNRRSKSKSKSKSRSRSKTGGNRNRNTRKNTHMSRSKTKIKTMKIKSKKFPKRIYLYSTPRTAQRMAYKYLGRIKNAKLYPARNPAKKYMVFDPKNNKWVNFGQMGYEDYTKHHDKTRRNNYLTRTKGMLGDWKSNKYSANNLSRRILWS